MARFVIPFLAPLLARATRDVVAQLNLPALVLSRGAVVMYANERLHDALGVDARCVGQSFFSISDGAFDTAAVRALLEEVDRDGAVHSRTVDRPFRGVGRKVLNLDLVPIRGGFFDTGMTVVTMQDDTARVVLEDEIARRAGREVAMASRLARLRVLDSPAATARQVVEQMAMVPGCDFLVVGLFDHARQFVPLALKVPPRSPLGVDRPVPPERSAYLHGRALRGPWVERWESRPEDGQYAEQMAATGIRAAAYAPIHGRSGLIGLLGMGTSVAAVADEIDEVAPVAISFGAIAGALLGPGHERHHDETLVRNEIAFVIANRAFEPVFQPIVNLVGGETVGYEALTRFADGRSPAARFAEAASHGVGTALELACLAAAFGAAVDLPRGRWLSVNASPTLISTESAALARLLGSTRRSLVVEVTEGAAIDDYATLRRRLDAFGRRIRVAVDDAGNGYAGLRRLLELRADIVKLDGALIAGIDRDPARQALIAGMAHFATKTGAELLAEGIERAAEAASLRELGVPLGQGFLFGRPAPSTAVSLVTPAVAPPTRANGRRPRVRPFGHPART